jgi:hypothetical protein
VDTDPASNCSCTPERGSQRVTDRLQLGRSLAEIVAGAHSIRRTGRVNILAPVIVRLFKEGLEELLAENGRLVLAGILEEQACEVIEAARSKELHLREQRQMGDWVALVF